GEPEPVATRDIVLPGGRATYRVFRRGTLPAGFSAQGPIVVTEESTSTPVPPGWTARVDGLAVLHHERKAQGADPVTSDPADLNVLTNALRSISDEMGAIQPPPVRPPY